MALEIQTVPRPEWSPLPQDGCVGVEGKVLISEKELLVAMLRFAPNATIHEHPGEYDADVICLEGSGRTMVGGEESEIEAGQRVRWPAGVVHRLWTEDNEMLTLMVERPPKK